MNDILRKILTKDTASHYNDCVFSTKEQNDCISSVIVANSGKIKQSWTQGATTESTVPVSMTTNGWISKTIRTESKITNYHASFNEPGALKNAFLQISANVPDIELRVYNGHVVINLPIQGWIEDPVVQNSAKFLSLY